MRPRPGQEAGGRAPAPAPLWRRIAWFVAIWLLSVSALALVAYAIRLVLL